MGACGTKGIAKESESAKCTVQEVEVYSDEIEGDGKGYRKR